MLLQGPPGNPFCHFEGVSAALERILVHLSVQLGCIVPISFDSMVHGSDSGRISAFVLQVFRATSFQPGLKWSAPCVSDKIKRSPTNRRNVLLSKYSTDDAAVETDKPFESSHTDVFSNLASNARPFVPAYRIGDLSRRWPSFTCATVAVSALIGHASNGRKNDITSGEAALTTPEIDSCANTIRGWITYSEKKGRRALQESRYTSH